MDFFEEQDLARKRTFRLALLFGFAVIGVSAAVYALGMAVYNWFGLDTAGVGYVTGRYDQVTIGGIALWEPMVFVVTVGSTLLLIVLGSLYKTAQLRDGGASVARSLGGRRVDPDSTKLDERRLLNVVEEMAIASGLPVPDVYVLDDESGINAFAAGKTTSDAVIGVTHGTLQLLRRSELQGVIGHEFSHILNGDSRLNVRAIGLLHGIFLLALIGRLMLHGSRGSRREGNGAALVGVGLLAIGSIGLLFGRMIQSAISRQRELLADASAVQFTRDIDGLVGALKKIGGAQTHSYLRTPGADEASHIFFSNAIRRLRMFQGLFRTHPPLGDRIRKLQPHWDGEFPEVALPSIAHSMSSPPDLLAEPLSAFAEAPSAASIDDAVDRIGAPRPRQIAHARAIHASLPDGWVHAVHQPPMAQAMVFGLLLAQDEVLRGSEIRAVADLTDSPTADLALRFHSEAGDRSSAQKIALVDMAMPALRSLSLDEYHRFRDVVQALIESDRRIALFEYTLSRMIQRHLARHFESTGPKPVQSRTLRALLPDLCVLLSTLAWVGSKSANDAAEALGAGGQLLQLGDPHLTLLPTDQCTLSAVDHALNRYEAATPTLKKSLMRACAAVVIADKHVTDREAELIRAIGDAIDCPVPPFVASEHQDGNTQRS
ncbi:MAG: M48 family metallopeptidase [Polyangiales bacterium]